MNAIEQIISGFFALVLASAQGLSWKSLSDRMEKKADIVVCKERHLRTDEKLEEMNERLRT